MKNDKIRIGIIGAGNIAQNAHIPAYLKQNEIRHFLDCVKTGQEPISSASDGVMIQKILNGIYDSARLGKEVKLD